MVVEDGSELAAELWGSAYAATSSVLAYPEGRAALAAARRLDLGLRGYDSVHLATALELGDDEVVIVTWDRDLARATERVGLSLAGPEDLREDPR